MSWLGFAAVLAWTIMVRSIPEPPDAPLTNLQLTRPPAGRGTPWLFKGGQGAPGPLCLTAFNGFADLCRLAAFARSTSLVSLSSGNQNRFGLRSGTELVIA